MAKILSPKSPTYKQIEVLEELMDELGVVITPHHDGTLHISIKGSTFNIRESLGCNDSACTFPRQYDEEKFFVVDGIDVT